MGSPLLPGQVGRSPLGSRQRPVAMVGGQVMGRETLALIEGIVGLQARLGVGPHAVMSWRTWSADRATLQIRTSPICP